MIEFGHLSHPGTLSACNESTYTGNGPLGFWTVLDGIGGEDCGEVASHAARNALQGSVRQGQPLNEAIRAADAAVRAIPKAKSNLRGASVVAMQLDSRTQQLDLAWVGSSRAFGIDANGQWLELTVADATIPSSIRTMALGVTDESRLHVAQATLQASDYQRILLCSDAVIPLIGERRASEILKEREWSAQEMVDTIAFEAIDADIEESFSLIALKTR